MPQGLSLDVVPVVMVTAIATLLSSQDGCNAAGIVMTLGPQGSPSTLGAALQTAPTRPRLPPQLLQQVYASDQQAAALLAQRQQAVLAGVAGLQAYAAALRLVLGPQYTTSSHHFMWEQAIMTALSAESDKVMYAWASVIVFALLMCNNHFTSVQKCVLCASKRDVLMLRYNDVRRLAADCNTCLDTAS